ncbi:MAG: hypothetical protein Kow0031_07080 [Anaerolineae bacterium]
MAIAEITQKQYLVRVSQQGVVVASHLMCAPDALGAINLVEQYYYQPVQVEKTIFEDGDGKRREVTTASNWHGYMFEAHAVEAAPASATHLRPVLIPYTEV